MDEIICMDLQSLQNICSQAYNNIYYTVIYFLIIYLLQHYLFFKIVKTPSSFIMVYNLTTFVKMLLSCVILVVYYFLFSKKINNVDIIKYSSFFILTYFVYLIINTKILFKQEDGE